MRRKIQGETWYVPNNVNSFAQARKILTRWASTAIRHFHCWKLYQYFATPKAVCTERAKTFKSFVTFHRSSSC